MDGAVIRDAAALEALFRGFLRRKERALVCFPEEGYSDLIGNRFAPGNYYKCASSACWTHKNCLSILVQIIDKYFGRLYMRISFL